MEAFINKLNEKKDKEEEEKNKQIADKSRKTYLQRQTRVINDLFTIFFGAESSKYYKPLLKLRINYEQNIIEPIERPIDQMKLSVALGQIV